MNTDHNRIKVADLEKNHPDKILTTNTDGELEFSDINNIKTDSYNALDYSISGKALDARQGKILKDLIDNINALLASDNVNLDTVQELVDAIETVQTSLNTILVNDLNAGGITKALTAEQGKVLKVLYDALVIIVNGKEDLSNKKTLIVGNETSDSFYGSIKAWITYLKFGFISLLPAKVTTLVDADLIMLGDCEDSFKTKTRTFSQLKATLKTYLDGFFQQKDEQIEVSTNSNVLNAWNGQTILFTANCIITVPSTLNSSLMFPFRTLPGVTVTWSITSPFTWETAPISTPEKRVGHFMRRGSTNTIFLDV
ncbi:hypothetical protein CLU83_1950 [Flavobacterium sp. 1]|uniref:hypothetical protein n=1 Tax=Flavobacterium sp. 1 TaxID=2035200 RepID=UPI000C246700|nr:hypothetical protein [Flavobacterium sp. 1]PJJ08664.1 hypothetical protein CLU83_1950 [Flavobacterium sp. 1]